GRPDPAAGREGEVGGEDAAARDRRRRDGRGEGGAEAVEVRGGDAALRVEVAVRPGHRAGGRPAHVPAAGGARVVVALDAEVAAVVVAARCDLQVRGAEVVAVLVDARRVVDGLVDLGLERGDAGRERAPVDAHPAAAADARVGVDAG